jgi:integrase
MQKESGMAKTVALVRRVKTDGGWRRYPVAYGKNGRVMPGYVQVRGEQVMYELGSYELRYYVERQPKYEPAGEVVSEALALLARFERNMRAQSAAEDAGIVLPTPPDRVVLLPAIEEMVQDAIRRQAPESAEMGGRIMREFVGITHYTYGDEITRDGVFGWHSTLRKKGNAERTINLKHARLLSFFRHAKLDTTVLPPAPKYEKTLPTVYDPGDVGDLLGKCDAKLNLVLSVAMQCGLREQELMHLTNSDIDYRSKTLRVRGKVKWGFKVKDSEQRDVAVPDTLLSRLKDWQEEQGAELLFGTSGGKPDGHLLRKLKRSAKSAGLNCGKCEGCKQYGECREWTLHRFRRSYMTTLLRNGVDVRTVQAMAGHSDIASTMRYLRPASGSEIQGKVNAIRWTD